MESFAMPMQAQGSAPTGLAERPVQPGTRVLVTPAG
jgi:hypothetical protein